jgi:hypothetical protein
MRFIRLAGYVRRATEAAIVALLRAQHDGDGISLRFSHWPTQGQDIVIRKPKPRTDTSDRA